MKRIAVSLFRRILLSVFSKLVFGIHLCAADLEIDIFSGRPNPRLTLEVDELAQVARVLAEASPTPPQDLSSAFPSDLGYRGVTVRGWPVSEPGSSVRIRGEHALMTSGSHSAWYRLADTRLEWYLVGLAVAKDLLSESLQQEIGPAIQKSSPNTLFLDDFNRRIDPGWSGPLPTTSNSYPSALFSYVGPPDHRFEPIESANVIRLTNSLSRYERRGWSTTATFTSTDFRCETRFFLESAERAKGGFIELWLLDARDSDRFDFTSLFTGFSAAPVTFGAAASLSNERNGFGWFSSQRNTFYRLVLEGSSSRNIRAALLSDAGEEIFSHAFQHTVAAFPEGFRIGLSQSMIPVIDPPEPRPTEVAIDFVHLTGTDSAAVNRLKLLYDLGAWEGRTAAPYQQLVRNWAPDFRALGVTNVSLRAESATANTRRVANYLFQDSGTQDATLRLRILVGNDVAATHRAMLDQLGLMTGAERLPLASSFRLKIGDRAYLASEAGDAVFFVRNNAFVFIDGSPAALPFAKQLDSQLVLASFSGTPLLEPRINGDTLDVFVPTIPGQTYLLESTDTLPTGLWTMNASLTGDGTIQAMTLPMLSSRQFLRLRVGTDPQG
jgi:hypothetical protein